MFANKGNQVVLLGPDSPSAFSASNPGGRNSHILRSLSKSFYTGKAVAIEEREVSVGSDWSEPGADLIVENFKFHDFRSRGKTTYLPLTAIVSAIGPTNSLSSIVDPALLGDLTVVNGASALTTPNRDFVLFGASAYYQAKTLKQANSFDEAGQLIGQPPVGIATLEMASRRLARYMQQTERELVLALSDIHPQTATGEEFNAMFRGIGVDKRGADEMTTQLVNARKEVASQREFTNRDLAQSMDTLLSGKSLPGAEPGSE
jgi:hypothetical protein